MKQDTGWHALREDELDSITPSQGVSGIQGIGQESIDKMQQTYSNSGISTQLPNEELISPQAEQTGLSMSDTIKLGTAMGKAFGKGIDRVKSYNKGVPTGMGASITEGFNPDVMGAEPDLSNKMPEYMESFAPRDQVNTGGIAPSYNIRNYMDNDMNESRVIIPPTEENPYGVESVIEKYNRDGQTPLLKTGIVYDASDDSRISDSGGFQVPQLDEYDGRIKTPSITMKDKFSRKYEGLTPMQALQKAASKFPIHFPAKDYYELSARLADGEKIPDKIKKENDIYKLSDIKNDVEREFYKQKIAKMHKVNVNDSNWQDLINNTPIIKAKEDSELAQGIKNSEVMRNWLAKNYEEIKNGNIKSSSIEFPNNDDKNSKNLYNILHYADIDNIKMNKDGSITLLTNDGYNYEYWDKEKQKNHSKKTIMLNNNAFGQQLKGKIQNYHLLAPVTYNKDELNEILKLYKKKE